MEEKKGEEREEKDTNTEKCARKGRKMRSKRKE